MKTTENLLFEFKFRIFEESYSRIFTCLEKLDEIQIWKKINPSIPSIGNLILHLNGNINQWIVSAIGGEKDNRNRDLEFSSENYFLKSELILILETTKNNVIKSLNRVNENNLFSNTVIQGFNTTYFSALIHVIEHFSYHSGQITLMTKYFTNQETNYYGGLNLNTKN